MNLQTMFSSKNHEHETPQWFFDALNEEFGFTLDPCCLPDTAKCEKYFTPNEDGLRQSWQGESVFVNPPYGREIGKWVRKSYQESRKPGTTVVMLIPARTDTAWLHEYIYRKAEIRFLRGRLRFGKCKNSAPFPSMLVVYRATSPPSRGGRGCDGHRAL